MLNIFFITHLYLNDLSAALVSDVELLTRTLPPGDNLMIKISLNDHIIFHKSIEYFEW